MGNPFGYPKYYFWIRIQNAVGNTTRLSGCVRKVFTIELGFIKGSKARFSTI